MTSRARWLVAAALGYAGLSCVGTARAEESALLGRSNPLAQLFPSATARAEQERAALSGRLEQALRARPGVSDAKIMITLSTADRVPLDQPLPPPRAAIMLQVDDPAFDLEPARALAASLLPPATELTLQAVRARTAALSNPSAPDTISIRRVGPFQVAPSSAGWLRGTLAALLITNAVLALLLLRGRARSG